MIVSRTHLRALDRIRDFRLQIVDPVDAALEGRLTPTPRLIRFLFVRPALCSQLPPDPTSR
jgi:hypothetical protein